MSCFMNTARWLSFVLVTVLATGAGAQPAPSAEAPVVTLDDKGFTVKSADSSYLLKIRGLVQVDGRSNAR